MENSLDTNLKNPYGNNTSLLKKIIDIFRPRRGAVLRRIYAGLNSDSVSPNASRTHSQGMFTPHGILDLKLSPAEITTLIESQTISNEERNGLITYMKSIETTSDMKTPDNEGVTYASSKDQEPPPKEHYFYAYKYKPTGLWFTTTLYSTPEEAHDALLEKNPARKKLCCIVI
jgi:hypothetical protein